MDETLIALGLSGFIYLCYYKCIVIPHNNKKREELRNKWERARIYIWISRTFCQFDKELIQTNCRIKI